jgi:hypothetical protein
MHPVIQKLAHALGTEVISRDANETWLFDGKTLADHYWIKPDLRYDPPGSKYCFEPQCVYYDDVSLLHELGHLQAAKPEQKDLPEFGLAMGIADGSGYGPNGGEFRQSNGDLRQLPYEAFDGLVDKEEALIQETLAQIFSIFWGQKYNIPFEMKGWNMQESWEFYIHYKIFQDDGQEHSNRTLQKTWAALIRFRQMIDEGEVAEV